MENPPIFRNAKPSISMGHLYHGYVSHNQRVNTSNDSHFPIKHGDFPIKNGDFPIKNGDFPVSSIGIPPVPPRKSTVFRCRHRFSRHL